MIKHGTSRHPGDKLHPKCQPKGFQRGYFWRLRLRHAPGTKVDSLEKGYDKCYGSIKMLSYCINASISIISV